MSLNIKDTNCMELFKSLKAQLNTNLSTGIYTYLNLKQPYEEISSSIIDISNSENIKAITALVIKVINATQKKQQYF